MKVKIKLKAQDDYIRVDTLSERHQNLLKAKGITYKYISFNRKKGHSQFLEELQHGKIAIPYNDIISRFKSEEGEIFKYLATLNPHSLWVEINRSKSNVNMEKERNSKLHLGLKRFSFHHATNDGTAEYITRGSNSGNIVIFFYKGIDKLIRDIKEKIDERDTRDKGYATTTPNNNRK